MNERDKKRKITKEGLKKVRIYNTTKIWFERVSARDLRNIIYVASKVERHISGISCFNKFFLDISHNTVM